TSTWTTPSDPRPGRSSSWPDASLLPARDPVGRPDAGAGVAEEAAARPRDADRVVLGREQDGAVLGAVQPCADGGPRSGLRSPAPGERLAGDPVVARDVSGAQDP